ncbi:hypothetical protein [Leptolyngbya sp. FACHB-261]|uniref:hypothetical protein n=1 Tax=Leptolyngbya sp. FACHB-261 TaxID=2692806 RepID=UPI001684C0C7|nr:hypothetical protein [Leptolyngbya sp. FACHB-261]MBD2100521.1 hypothetical protein [Leptolyngbya sp. FACHB-261]
MFSTRWSSRSVLALAVLLASGLIGLPASAQTATEVLQAPPVDGQQGIDGSNFNVLDFVNQAVLRGNGPSPAQFEAEQQRSLNREYTNYRQQRQQLQIGPTINSSPSQAPTGQPNQPAVVPTTTP